MELDHIDRKILNILLENARIPLKDLAQQVFLSSPAVSARIQKLEKAGIIKKYGTQLDLLKLDYHVKAFINVEMEPEQKNLFYPYIKKVPNVIECNHVTGNYSMLLEVVFHSTAELDLFIGHLQRFGKTSTQIVFSTIVEHRGVHLKE